MTKLPCCFLAPALLVACTSSEPASRDPAVQSSAAAAGSTATAASSAPGRPGAIAAPASAIPTASVAADAAPDLSPPTCTRSREKVWGTGASKLTGLTTKRLDKKTAVGYAIGIEPRVLVIDKGGKVSSLKVKTGAKAVPPAVKEGYRNLMRVSPMSIKGGTARAFLDYRDDYKDKRRRVACGPADSDENFLAFDGTSYLDMDPKPTGEDKKKLFSWKKEGTYAELRDCRTFVTRSDNETWALGSVLRGIEKPDGTNEWKMKLLVSFGASDEEIVLHEVTLKGDPPKLSTYEIPTSRGVKDNGFVVATRFGGALMVGVLDKSRKLRGSFKTYRGFPSMPDISSTEEDLIILTGVGTGQEKSLKALVIPKDTLTLPAGYVDVTLPPMDASGASEAMFTAPELTVDAKGQRWLTYVEGPKDKGHLRIVPLDKNLEPSGRAFSVTVGDVFASEGRLSALEDGTLAVAYLREVGGKVEIVTERLSCEVKK